MIKSPKILLLLMLTLVSCTGIESWIHEDVDSKFTEQKFNREQLTEDLKFLSETIKVRHPAYKEYADHGKIDKKYNEISSSLKDNMTRKDFFLSIGEINPFFRDGHSFVFPLLAEYTFGKKSGQSMFPLSIHIHNERIYARQNYVRKSDNYTISKDIAISKINNVSSKEILNKLQKYSHGETADLRKHMSTLLFPYWLYSIFDFKDSFIIETEDNKPPLKISKEDVWETQDEDLIENWFKMQTNDTGYLRLGSFDVNTESGEFSDIIEGAFTEMKKNNAKNLIIDIRNNTGGQTDAGAEVIGYLTTKRLNQASMAIEKLNQDNNGIFGYRGKPGETVAIDVTNGQMIEPADADLHFSGKTLVLINEMTYSAGIVFATTVQDHGLATLVGQATGGFSNQTGNMVPFYLPNTKLLVLAPSRYIRRVSGLQANQPVMPDTPVIENPATAQDDTLSAALGILSH